LLLSPGFLGIFEPGVPPALNRLFCISGSINGQNNWYLRSRAGFIAGEFSRRSGRM